MPVESPDTNQTPPIDTIDSGENLPQHDIIFDEKLAEASQAVKNGNATEVQKALVISFERGAAAANEVGVDSNVNPSKVEHKSDLMDFIGDDDAMAITLRKIERLRDDIISKEMFGQDATELRHELEGQTTYLDYLNTRNSKDEYGLSLIHIS